MMNDKKRERNPFVLARYVSPDYFCDRVVETDKLRENVLNGRHTVLLSPRRMGKTGLIQHFFRQDDIQKEFFCFYVDILSTQSLSHFVYTFMRDIYDAVKREESWLKKLSRFIKSVQFNISFDPTTSSPTWGLSIGDIKSPEMTLSEIFEFLDQLDRPVVVAIDEFQRITEYKDEGVEALLRSKLQFAPNVRMIFSGSEMHTLATMFSSYAKPFYQFAVFLTLGAIDKGVYRNFAKEKFIEYGKVLNESFFNSIYEEFQGRTWDVHVFLNKLFIYSDTLEEAGKNLYSAILNEIVLENQSYYQSILGGLSLKQIALVMAIAKEGSVKELQSADFCFRHSLGAVSSVQSAARVLVEKNVIRKEDNMWKVDDPYFRIWCLSQ